MHLSKAQNSMQTPFSGCVRVHADTGVSALCVLMMTLSKCLASFVTSEPVGTYLDDTN